MTKRRTAELMSEGAAKERHKELMQDPEYAAKWNALTSQLFGLLADLPVDALDDTPPQSTTEH